MNMLSSLSAIKVNVLIGIEDNILPKFFSNFTSSLIELNLIFFILFLPSSSNDVWLNSFLSN